MFKRMNLQNIQASDAAIFMWSITTLTVAQMNVLVAAVTGIAGLSIQLYFKRQQNKREQEEHDWKKKNQN